jgi:gas vesicle protein
MLKVLISFIFGAAVGAAAALLMAPSSGEELRSHLHEVADADRQRMRAEYQKGMDELHVRVDKMSSAVHKDNSEVEEVDVEAEITVEAESDVE